MLTQEERVERKKARDRAYYQRNKERIKEYQREYYQENSEMVKERERKAQKAKRTERRLVAVERLGGKCMDCGLDNEVVLQFHHRPGTEKVGEVTALATSEKKFWAEVEKCDLVCGNCHLIRHIEGR